MSKECKATTKIRAITRQKIVSDVEISGTTAYRKLKKLIDIGYVKNGHKAGREHTYFITTKGIEELEEARV